MSFLTVQDADKFFDHTGIHFTLVPDGPRHRQSLCLFRRNPHHFGPLLWDWSSRRRHYCALGNQIGQDGAEERQAALGSIPGPRGFNCRHGKGDRLAVPGRRTAGDDSEDRFLGLEKTRICVSLHAVEHGHSKYNRSDICILSRVEFVCLWQWPCNCSISSWRRSPGTSLADRNAVS